MESKQKNMFMDSWPCRHCIKIGISMGSSSKSAFSIFPSPKVWAQPSFPDTFNRTAAFLHFSAFKLQNCDRCRNASSIQSSSSSKVALTWSVEVSKLSTQWGHWGSRECSPNSSVKAHLATSESRLKSKFWDSGNYWYIDILDQNKSQ